MARKIINPRNEAEILSKSRRRCSLCFALENNFKIRRGQIAHIDRNNENAELENLVFLCFDHHDEYDSITSQSKGLKPNELKIYRNRLYEYIEDWDKNKLLYHFNNETQYSNVFTIYKIINPESELGYDWVALNSSRDTFISVGFEHFAIENFNNKHVKWLNLDYSRTPTLTFTFEIKFLKDLIEDNFFERNYDITVFQDSQKNTSSLVLKFFNPEGDYEIVFDVKENILLKNLGEYSYQYPLSDDYETDVKQFAKFNEILNEILNSINYIKDYDAP